MAFSVVPTYVTNQLITAAHGNTYWRDNLNALFPFLAAGDIAYANSTTTLAALEKGEAGQVLKMNPAASAPMWGKGAQLLDWGIDKLTSEWESTTTQAFQDTPLSLDLVLPVSGIVVALFNGAVRSNSSSYDVLYRVMIDDEAGVSHVGDYSNGVPGSAANVKLCAAGTITCKVQAYGYLSSKGYIDDGELVAFAFPA